METRMLEVLRSTFGLQEFRDKQKEVITHVLQGGSSLVLFPTGGGKSLCYQLPALLLDGVTIVISPLISLMQDQVTALRARNVDARYCSSNQDASANQQVLADLAALPKPKVKILYTTPERMAVPLFAHLLQDLHTRGLLAAIAVDEAHCISQVRFFFYCLLSSAPRSLILVSDLKLVSDQGSVFLHSSLYLCQS